MKTTLLDILKKELVGKTIVVYRFTHNHNKFYQFITQGLPFETLEVLVTDLRVVNFESEGDSYYFDFTTDDGTSGTISSGTIETEITVIR